MTEVRLHDWSDTPLKAWLSHAAAHLRASPPAAGPCQKATADRLTTEMEHFFDLKLLFGDLEAPFWVPGTSFW